MPKRLALTNLNGRTIDILNVIRNNASWEYQQNIPVINDAQGIPAVGEVLYGNSTLCNEFINALVNRIALVVVSSATFNNPYRDLKKGYLEYGENVEEIFVQIAKVQEFSVEKAPSREFKRTIPDVKSAFHVMNWRVLYPITIQREDLRRAFLNADGVENLITSILDQIYTASEYDEFLLFKYLVIKTVSAGKAYPVAIDTSNGLDDAATKFRGFSNYITFLKDYFNECGVLTTTPKERQNIFMDSMFNAQFDVEELSRAFNMDKADFMGKLRLIDDFTTFDNARWNEIRANSESIEEVTAEELALMQDVKAVLVDDRFFQIYDNENYMTDTRVASGLYWNYFYHVWKTVSHSPFSNIVVFVDTDGAIAPPESITFKVETVTTSEVSKIITLAQTEDVAFKTNVKFVQTEELTEMGVAVHQYGAFIVPLNATEEVTTITPVLTVVGDTTGTEYTADAITVAEVAEGDTVTFAPSVGG